MKKIRCAIYTRKSAEEGLEQEFNSLDAQREACAAYVASQKAESWVLLPTVYEDAGLSGGTLARCGKDLLYPETVDASVEVRSVGLVSVRVTPSPLHDYRERSAKYGTVGCDGEPYTWRRQPWKWRCPASPARHARGELPREGWPCSYSVSAHVFRERRLVVQAYAVGSSKSNIV